MTSLSSGSESASRLSLVGLVLMMIAIERLMCSYELKQIISKRKEKEMVGDPPIRREGFLALQEDIRLFLSFQIVLGMLYYQEG